MFHCIFLVLKGATTSTPKGAINNGRERQRVSQKSGQWGSNRRTSAYDGRRSTTAPWELLHVMFLRPPRHSFFSKSDISREGEREEERARERARATRDRHVDSSGPTTRLLYVTVLRPIVLFGTLQNLNSGLRLFLPLIQPKS